MKRGIISLSVLFILNHSSFYGKEITIVGCGYVGLTMAGVLSDCGHKITCVDIDTEKISQLADKKLPIYEPELKDLLFNSPYSEALTFTNDLNQAKDAKIFYVCVSTPTDVNGKCDCSFLYSAFETIVAFFSRQCTATDFKIICIKSTVPPGTIRKLHDYVIEKNKKNIHIVYNPEFMREGSAINDIYTNNPIVLGGESLEAMQTIENLYNGVFSDHIKIIKTNFETAEMIKYAWNSFSAIRIAYINELAVLCRLLNGDVSTLIKGFALSEKLLPTENIKPGPGCGGSCLPKDTVAFTKVMEENGFSSSMVHQAIKSNNSHKERLIQDIFELLTETENPKVVTLLGLSFKANTSDIRYAPSIDVIKALVEKGIIIKAYDPKAINSMKELFPFIQYFDSPYEAVKGADCIVILTEWEEIKKIDFNKVALLCNNKIIFDTRNIFNVDILRQYGFKYLNMGAI